MDTAEIAKRAEGKTVLTNMLPTVERLADVPQVRWKTDDGEWGEWTWRETHDKATRIASALKRLGMQPKERLALMMLNRPEFYPCDSGALLADLTPFSIYNSSSPEQIAYVVGHSEATMAIVENAAFLERFEKVRSDLPAVREIITIEPVDGYTSLDDLLGDDPIDVEAAVASVSPDDIATLVYTSGTTGPPKGAMLTQGGLAWTIESIRERTDGVWSDRTYISYLPLAHVLERFLAYYWGAAEGGTVTTCPDPALLAEYLGVVKPEAFVGVPRVWEKIYGRLQAALGAQPPEGQAAFNEALAIGRKAAEHKIAGTPMPDDLKAKHEEAEATLGLVRSLIGLDNVKVCGTGAAPTPQELMWFFLSLGLPLAEGYGMTETSFIISLDPVHYRPGTVGRPVPGQEVKIAEDGEVLVRGPNVIPGYLKDPEKTAEAIDPDGWLHTGDIGSLDEDGYLRIVDRKKELIITAGGKNISPANIEAALKSFPLISQACAIGDGKKFISALLTLDQDVLPGWAAEKGLEGTPEELAENETVRAEVERCVEEANKGFNKAESVKKFTIIPGDWDATTGELTPTMKLKRRVIHEKYADQIEAMYA